MSEGPRAWRRVKSEPGEDLKIFKVRRDVSEHPGSKKHFDRVVLEAPDWVNVVALTEAREVILVEQFRFGADEVTTEIVAGLVDAGEEPLEAAKRELREETGYTSESWTLLGTAYGNPAFLNNTAHMFLAEDARLTEALDPDEGEDVTCYTATLEEVRARILDGRIRHALTMAAMARVISLCP